MIHDSIGGPGSSTRLAGAGTLLVIVLGLLIAAFAWPATSIGPRGVPLAVAGPEQAVAGIASQLGQVELVEGEQAFDINPVDDEGAAEQAIRDREVYGAIVVGPQGPQLLVASAASPAVAQMLVQGTSEMAQGAPLAVRDVVPTPADDPRGTGFAASLLPLVLGGVALGAVVWALGRSAVSRVLALAGLALAAGFVEAAVLQYGFSVLSGSYLLNSLVIAAIVLALAAPITGLAATLGRAGVALGAGLMVLLGNPWSGITSAPQMLAQPWGDVGAAMPPGAGGSLLRSVAFFDGAAAGPPALVLSVWALAGLVLVGLGALRHARKEQPAAEELAATRLG